MLFKIKDTSLAIGTVITGKDSPSTQKVEFVLRNEHVKTFRGELVIVHEMIHDKERVTLLQITEIQKVNMYYQSVDSARIYENAHRGFESVFPTDQWEYVLCIGKPLGELVQTELRRVTFPVSPGAKVYRANENILKNFLGFDEHGLYLGHTPTANVPVKVNLDRLLRKHLAILAISGAGKSHTASVLLEELLFRKASDGRINIVVIDPHGEYRGFSEVEEFKAQTTLVDAAEFSIAVKNLSAWDFLTFKPDMSPVQTRELDKIIQEFKKKEDMHYYGLIDLIKAIETKKELKASTRDALIGWLENLNRSRIFSLQDHPDLEEALKQQGRLIIFDLSSRYDSQSKEIITTYVLKQIFKLRRKDAIPPVLIVVEEAHQFCPEGRSSISKGIIETIAREGRKFFTSLCLISQRPVNLSVTALSQCNTHLIMRIRNPYDIDYIGRTSEGIDKMILRSLPDLDVGEGILVGNAVNYPTFFKVRERRVKPPRFEMTLEEAAKQFEENKR